MTFAFRSRISPHTRCPSPSFQHLRFFSCFILVAPVILTAFLCVGPALGKVSTNVPLDDFAYRDLEKLLAQGLIGSDLCGTRPISRLEMARLVHEAHERWERLPQEERQNLALIQEILTRLEKNSGKSLVS